MTVLTVDLGNSRLKACLWKADAGPRPEPLKDIQIDNTDLEGFARWLRTSRPRAAALASVAANDATARVRELLTRQVGELHVAPDCGLENRCTSPERVGQDRLYAAAGAFVELGCSALVVDAGTALTVDALLVDGPLRAFLGGAIAPGPALLVRALADGTARLPRIDPRPGARALGRGTEEAIQAGVVVGFRGAARLLVEQVAREADLPDAPVVITGGASSFLLEPEPFLLRPWTLVPDLVHRGLLSSLQRALRSAGTPAPPAREFP